MSLYNIKNFEGHYVIAKFTDDLDLESTYEYHIIDGVHTCHCPAGVRPTCRHRQMFPLLHTRVDTGWFLDFDTRQWVDPMGEASNRITSCNCVSMDECNNRDGCQIVEKEQEKQSLLGPSPRDDHPFRRRM